MCPYACVPCAMPEHEIKKINTKPQRFPSGAAPSYKESLIKGFRVFLQFGFFFANVSNDSVCHLSVLFLPTHPNSLLEANNSKLPLAVNESIHQSSSSR